jgi:hypothetical protein
MEEFDDNLEIIERGLLSEVNADDEIIVVEQQEPRFPDQPYSDVPRSKPAATRQVNVSSKVLNYLGNVQASNVRNPKAWLLQTLLNELGYSLKPDGYFGSMTDEKVKQYQADHGLKQDGIVGRGTWSELIYQGQCRITNAKLVDTDYKTAASSLGVEVAAVKAVKKVESGGAGFLFSNHPAILFEGHIFWKELKKRGIDPNTIKNASDILYPSWTKDHYAGGICEYVRLQKARWINEEAANASASWGLFQIMGNNHNACGIGNVNSFVDAMCISEGRQLELFVAFLKRYNLQSHLQRLNWAGFAAAYNGSGYKKNKYDEKLEAAYNSFK